VTREPSPRRVEPFILYVMVFGRKRLATIDPFREGPRSPLHSLPGQSGAATSAREHGRFFVSRTNLQLSIRGLRHNGMPAAEYRLRFLPVPFCPNR
jgi:hypothetical protein